MARSVLSGAQNLDKTSSEFRPGLKTLHDPYNLESIFSHDIIQYRCSCNRFRRLVSTYFCRHCMALRCRSCVTHEVDSQYCQHCLEYIPTIDPKFQMNKCASCYQCPSCQHLLSTTVLSVSPLASDQQVQKDEVVTRTCQLVCEFCQWTSETFVTDKSRVTSNLADDGVQNAARITELMTFYKNTSQKEKADKKMRRFHQRSVNTMDLLKKYGIANSLSPKLFESLRARTTFHSKTSSTARHNLTPRNEEDNEQETIEPAQAYEADGLDKLDEEFYYNKSFDPEKMSSIDQRLAQVELQPDAVSRFKPIGKSLSVKRSLRCKECERNLCRGEYSPIVIKFKIQSASYYRIPELKLRNETYPIDLSLNEINIVELSIQNNNELSPVNLKLESLEGEDQDLYELDLPKSELSLSQFEKEAVYHNVPIGMRPLNEESQIVFRSAFKIGFFIKVRPKRRVDNLCISFSLAHDVMLLQNPREDNKIERISHTVRILLGPVR